jgi:hypothetical protein
MDLARGPILFLGGTWKCMKNRQNWPFLRRLYVFLTGGNFELWNGKITAIFRASADWNCENNSFCTIKELDRGLSFKSSSILSAASRRSLPFWMIQEIRLWLKTPMQSVEHKINLLIRK